MKNLLAVAIISMACCSSDQQTTAPPAQPELSYTIDITVLPRDSIAGLHRYKLDIYKVVSDGPELVALSDIVVPHHATYDAPEGIEEIEVVWGLIDEPFRKTERLAPVDSLIVH